jgi:hypothetical protein
MKREVSLTCMHDGADSIACFRLNMRTTFNLYKALGNFIDHCDAEAEAQGDDSEDKTIDQHFRSGVYLGVGLSHLVLSLLPQRLVNVVQLFGFHGDRHEGLKILCRAGGWTEDNEEPSIRRGAFRKYSTLHPLLTGTQKRVVFGVRFATSSSSCSIS